MNVLLTIVSIILVIALPITISYLYYLKETFSLSMDDFHPLESSIVYLSYGDFLHYYHLNPDRWILAYDGIIMKTGDRVKILPGLSGMTVDKTIAIKFEKLSEIFKYRKFYKQKIKNENQVKKDKATIELLQIIQKDIDDLRAQANQELKEGAEATIDVVNNLNEKGIYP
jgi:hypothetical protein